MNPIDQLTRPTWVRLGAIFVLGLTGCATAPRSWLAPVEDRSAKSSVRQAAPTAQAMALPDIFEEAPLRADPLPLSLPKAATEPSLAPSSTDQSFGPITKKGSDQALPLPPKVVSETARPQPMTSSSPSIPSIPTASTPGSVPPPKPPAPKTAAAPSTLPPPPVVPPPPPPRVEIQPPKPIRPALSSSNTGVVALLDKADDLAASGQVDSAAVTLERALRIEPENGRLWHELASIRLRQGRVDAAISVAEKSNSLARNQRELQARNWRLIAVARKKQGQEQAAIEALNRARALD